MSVSIRSVSKNQIESVVSIFKSIVMPLPYYNDDAKKQEIEKYDIPDIEKKIETDPDSVLVAEENNQVVGFCFNRIDDMTIWIEWFGVNEVARRNGVAKQLIQYLELTAQRRDIHKIWCDCRTENMKSINLLSSCGYTPICTLKNHWYKQDFILWQKEIPL